ncbi:MAG: DNA gyrase inhibitor YacG [Myxococcota bacterium]|nr:DNA gyrase inhibitor YacG [Myxococcota bacterium]
MLACPICRRPAALRAENTAFPFCSIRCKQIDLGAWLDEKYRVPTAESPDDDSSSLTEASDEEKP